MISKSVVRDRTRSDCQYTSMTAWWGHGDLRTAWYAVGFESSVSIIQGLFFGVSLLLGQRAYLATPKPFAMGAASGAEPSYGSNLARRSKLILGLSAAVLGLFLVARIVVEDILPRFGISGGSSTLRWW